eukprot:8233177-Ditylum_brightwellii.AAC.1
MGGILALPTTPCTTEEDSQSNLSHIADSIQAVVAATSGVLMALAPSISGIQHQSKTALGCIKTKEDLTQYYKVLVLAQHEGIAGMLSSMTYVFVHEGYTSKEASQRSQSCLPYCIMRDADQWQSNSITESQVTALEAAMTGLQAGGIRCPGETFLEGDNPDATL